MSRGRAASTNTGRPCEFMVEVDGQDDEPCGALAGGIHTFEGKKIWVCPWHANVVAKMRKDAKDKA